MRNKITDRIKEQNKELDRVPKKNNCLITHNGGEIELVYNSASHKIGKYLFLPLLIIKNMKNRLRENR